VTTITLLAIGRHLYALERIGDRTIITLLTVNED